MSGETLKPEHLKARLIRALSGLSQEQMSEKTGIPPSVLARIEMGKAPITGEELERMAEQAGFDTTDADELLHLYEARIRAWLRTSEGTGSILGRLVLALRRHSAHAVRRLLQVPPPNPADPGRAREQLAQLKRLSQRSRLAVVTSAEEYRNPALARLCREEAEREAGNPRRAAAWTRLATEIGQSL
ncbi:MAG TPA: helix-turn-helix transcriptional regulator [Thermoanaerobaculia bacterium]|nr:helix-turn-helix transcriptional regulator [Thermoanaerobaculia bacterium]